MIKLNGFSVLIVDPSQTWGTDLRTHLSHFGAKVHVVASRAAARMLSQNKRIDVAVVDFRLDDATRDLCANLTEKKIPFFFGGGSHIESWRHASSEVM